MTLGRRNPYFGIARRRSPVICDGGAATPPGPPVAAPTALGEVFNAEAIEGVEATVDQLGGTDNDAPT
jgi:hypothetical protein